MISLYKKNYPNLVAAAKQIRQSNLENYDEEEDEVNSNYPSPIPTRPYSPARLPQIFYLSSPSTNP